MTTTEIVFLVVVLICILLSGYFSATETAFTAVNKIRLRAKAEDGDKGAKRVLKLADNYDRLLTTILIGNNVVNILASSLFTLLLIALIPQNEGLATTLSTVILTVVVLIFGEITPKVLAKEFPEGFARFAAPTINLLAWILFPFTFLFGLWKKLLLKIFKHKEDNAITDDELKIMVEEAEQEGGINAQESDLIRSAIEFNDLEAKDILVPRVDVVSIDCETDLDEVDKIFMETRYSRLPVYKDSIDNIIGILHEKDFIKHRGDEGFSLEKAVKPTIFVVSTTKISAVLQQLQKSKSHMAVVSGEFGDTVGIVTMEDILEELVGEIWDEHDEVLSDITKVSETEYNVLGSTTVNDMCDYFGLGDIESDSATVGGWVIDMLGKVPNVGDELTYRNLQITVSKAEFRRITQLKVIILTTEEDSEEE
ncbi:MAG: hemolysin family protein [Clostridia bacterium]|nr:hemolysin family protein [Clostridia bacterium]